MVEVTLQELFNNHQKHHSAFQINNFIIGKTGGTKYGQYKQALRELHKRWRGLKSVYADRELKQIDLDELEATENLNVFDQLRNDIKCRQIKLGQVELEKDIEDTEREFKRFYAIALKLHADFGELDSEKRAKLETELWIHRAKLGAAFDLMAYGRLSRATIEQVMAFPAKIKRELLPVIAPDPTDQKAKERLIAWAESQSFDSQPELTDGEINVAGLLEG